MGGGAEAVAQTARSWCGVVRSRGDLAEKPSRPVPRGVKPSKLYVWHEDLHCLEVRVAFAEYRRPLAAHLLADLRVRPAHNAIGAIQRRRFHAPLLSADGSMMLRQLHKSWGLVVFWRRTLLERCHVQKNLFLHLGAVVRQESCEVCFFDKGANLGMASPMREAAPRRRAWRRA